MCPVCNAGEDANMKLFPDRQLNQGESIVECLHGQSWKVHKMDSQLYTNNEPETEINLLDMLWDLLGQWKAIAIVAIVMALAVPGLKLWRDNRSYQASLANTETQTQQMDLPTNEVIEQTLEGLSKDDRTAIELVVKQSQHAATESKYLGESILMSTDPTHQRTLTLSYLINSNDGVSASALTNAYAAQLHQDELLHNLGTLIDPNAELGYIDELVTAQYDLVQDSSITQNPLTIRVVLPEEADAKAVGNAIDAYLNAVCDNLRVQVGEHTLQTTSRTEQYLYNEVARSRRAALISDVNNTRSSIKTNVAALSADQKSAYTSIANHLDAQQSNDEKTSDSVTNNEKVNAAAPTNAPKPPSLSVKFALAGFVLGIVLYAIAYVTLVVVRSQIGSEQVLVGCTGSRLLGSVYYPEQHSGLSALFHSSLVDNHRFGSKGSVDIQMRKAASAIEAVCEHTQAANVHVLCVEGTQEIDIKTANDLVSMLASHGFDAHLLNADTHMDEMELLPVQKAIFLASAKAKSADAWRTTMLCHEYDIVSLGCVFVRAY